MIMVMGVAVTIVMMSWYRRNAIRPALRHERRLDGNGANAEARQQSLCSIIADKAQALGQNLHRNVAIPKLPGETCELADIGFAHFEQGFRLGDHLDEPPVIEHEGVAHPQHCGGRKIDFDAYTADGYEARSACLALLAIENDAVGCGSGIIAPGVKHLRHAWHGRLD